MKLAEDDALFKKSQLTMGKEDWGKRWRKRLGKRDERIDILGELANKEFELKVY